MKAAKGASKRSASTGGEQSSYDLIANRQIAKLLVLQACGFFQADEYQLSFQALCRALPHLADDQEMLGSLFIMRAGLSLKIQDYENVIVDTTNALLLDSTSFVALLRRISAFLRLSRVAEAQQDLRRVVEVLTDLRPPSRPPHEHVVRAAVLLGEKLQDWRLRHEALTAKQMAALGRKGGPAAPPDEAEEVLQKELSDIAAKVDEATGYEDMYESDSDFFSIFDDSLTAPLAQLFPLVTNPSRLCTPRTGLAMAATQAPPPMLDQDMPSLILADSGSDHHIVAAQEEEAFKQKELGNMSFSEGHYEDALFHYSEAIFLNNTDPVFFSNRAAVYLKLKQYHHAISDCTMSIERKPTIKAYSRRASGWIGLKEYALAAEDCRKALGYEPRNKDCLKQLTDCLTLMEKQTRIKMLQNPFSRVLRCEYEAIIKELVSLSKSAGQPSDPAAASSFQQLSAPR
eukprot:TRINITY_DN8664_c0_g1_i1.p1 TRINITY_DN8664_c0_g1~~TRINITY_DN8664_c0_g1_i1.p1  ORF type:complete len:465 (-),score=113.77 TRINITY_DN8664_c0_g1_i1:23-1396(-)